MTLELPFLKKRKFLYNLDMKVIPLIAPIILFEAAEFVASLMALEISAMSRVSFTGPPKTQK